MSAPLSRARISRRTFLAAGAALGAGSLSGPGLLTVARAADPPAARAATAPRPRIAAINSIYRMRSHAFHIAGRFIDGYTREGFHHQPPFPAAEIGDERSKRPL